MKRFLKLFGTVLGGVLALLLTGAVLLYGLVWLAVHPKPTVIQELPSPDGEYVAYVYESNGGATTGFIYRLSILRQGQRLGRGNGNTFIQEDDPFSVAWISDRTLWVENSSTLHRQRTHVNGIEVQYRYPKPAP